MASSDRPLLRSRSTSAHCLSLPESYPVQSQAFQVALNQAETALAFSFAILSFRALDISGLATPLKARPEATARPWRRPSCGFWKARCSRCPACGRRGSHWPFVLGIYPRRSRPWLTAPRTVIRLKARTSQWNFSTVRNVLSGPISARSLLLQRHGSEDDQRGPVRLTDSARGADSASIETGCDGS
jgi:hypothetical protein